MCLHLVVMDRVDQRMSVALGCVELVGGNNFGMCRVRGGICNELRVVVFNALVLCLRGTRITNVCCLHIKRTLRLSP